jgi:hypothetical protein
LAEGFNERSDFEFIELQNIGSRYINLTGLQFTAGIEFEFGLEATGLVLAPGERVLLVNNLEAFELRYGGGKLIAGVYSGNLDNDGEQLLIAGPDGGGVLDLTYNDASPWPESADGDGYSLVLINPGVVGDLSSPERWRTSVALNGNPGEGDSLSYTSWNNLHGGFADDVDKDGDGLNHLMEYALGGDPFQSSPGLVPFAEVRSFEIEGIKGDYLAIDIRRRLGADDVSLVVELSDSPVNWSQEDDTVVLVGVINNDDGTETMSFRIKEAVADGGRVFVRARFILAQ